jgi:hypothetical protein
MFTVPPFVGFNSNNKTKSSTMIESMTEPNIIVINFQKVHFKVVLINYQKKPF